MIILGFFAQRKMLLGSLSRLFPWFTIYLRGDGSETEKWAFLYFLPFQSKVHESAARNI